VAPLGGVLLEEGVAEAVAGIGAEDVDRPAARGVDEAADAVLRGEIGLDRADLDDSPWKAAEASISGSSAATSRS
jgi:hypothetical protein